MDFCLLTYIVTRWFFILLISVILIILNIFVSAVSAFQGSIYTIQRLN